MCVQLRALVLARMKIVMYRRVGVWGVLVEVLPKESNRPLTPQAYSIRIQVPPKQLQGPKRGIERGGF
jgi:hypothetical protein